MHEPEVLESWEQIETLVAARDAEGLAQFLDELQPGEVGRAFTRLDNSVLHDVLVVLPPKAAAGVIETLSDTQGSDLVEVLTAAEAAAIVDEMESDRRADILGEMTERYSTAILHAMDPEEARDARNLLAYGGDTAGGVMVTEFVAYAQGTTVAEVLEDLRANAERYSDFGVQYAYVTNANSTLVGVIRLRDLVLAPAESTVQDIMIVNPLYVLVDAPLDEVAQFFDRYPFYSVPATDATQRMVGVVRRADVEEAIGEGHERNLLRFGGIIGGEELRSMRIGERASRRMVWLGLNLPLSLLAAAVIPIFEHTIVDFPALLFFIPVIGNLCGCSGNQAIAVSIREMTMGLIRPADFMRVMRQELEVGLINGTVLGTAIIGVACMLDWVQGYDVPILAIFIGLAFFINTIVAVCLGGVVPLLLRRFNVDAALGAPPIQSTVTDMCGLFVMFALATLALRTGLLVPVTP